MAEFIIGGRYHAEAKLGEGSFGIVYRAIDKQENDRIVALKEINDINHYAKVTYREIYILRRLKHPSVIALFDVFNQDFDREELLQLQDLLTHNPINSLPLDPLPDKLFLAFEIMDSDLKTLLRKVDTFLDEDHIQFMMFQFLTGLQYIHMKNVIHRDLKSANVLVNLDNYTIKIADLGLSRVVAPAVEEGFADLLIDTTATADSVESILDDDANPQEPAAAAAVAVATVTAPLPLAIGVRRGLQPIPVQRGYTQHVATRWYRAPEIILLQQYSTPVDVWSAGCIFAEMLGCMVDNKAAYGVRKALFPGYPFGDLSADHDDKEEAAYRQCLIQGLSQNHSQLSLIFNVLGNPSTEDIATLDPVTASILRQAPYRPGFGLERFFPACKDTAAMDLLKKMLIFNPQRRISIVDALNHPFFDSLKQQAFFSDYISKLNAQELDLTPIPEIDVSKQNLSKNFVDELLLFAR